MELSLEEFQASSPDAAEFFDGYLKDELRCRLAQDKLWNIHLRCYQPGLLANVISLLMPCAPQQEKSIESIVFDVFLLPELSGFWGYAYPSCEIYASMGTFQPQCGIAWRCKLQT